MKYKFIFFIIILFTSINGEDKIYLFRESSGNLLPFSYDLNTDTWEEKTGNTIGSILGIESEYDISNDRLIILKWSSSYVTPFSYNPNSDSWIEKTAKNISSSNGIASSYDNEDNKIVLFDKYDHSLTAYSYDLINDTWEDKSTFTIASGETFSSYDEENDLTVLFSISDGSVNTYSYDLNMDSLVEKSSNSIGSHQGIESVYDKENDKIIILKWNGSFVTPYSYDLNTDVWTEKAAHTIGSTTSIAASYDIESNKSILIKYYGNYFTAYSFDYTSNSWSDQSSQSIASADNITASYWGHLSIDSSSTWHVSTIGSDSNDGSEVNPFATIQHGIDASSDGDTVLVTAGTYVENINFNGKNIAVIGEDRETTIIDGNQNGSVVTFTSGEDSTAVFSGFTITNGSGTLYLSEYSGGGIYFNSASPKIENVIIKNNDARDGGGIFSYSSSPSLTNVMISNNIAFYSGGGISYTFANNPTLTNVIITENTAEWGGGIFCYYSSPSLKNVTIKGNLANSGGGGVYLNDSSPLFSNVKITGNTAGNSGWNYGGGVYCYASNPTLSNVTISANSAIDDGGGIFSHISNPSLFNCIVWNNNSENEIVNDGGSILATYSNIQGSWAGEGNINVDPLFTDPDNGDYNLQDSSPCIGAGIDSIEVSGTWYFAPETDLDGNIRPNPNGSNPDMGAYENELPSRIVNNIFVSNDGNDFTGDGSNENPFQNIQWAIDRAYIGDTVTVLNGSYSENLTITTDNLHLIGESQDSVIITSETSSDETIYIEDVDNILINNLTLLGNGGDGIWVYESKNYTVKNILIEGFTNYGYGFKSSKSSSSFETYGIFDSVKVINNSTGLLIYSSNLQLSNSLIDSNTIGMNIGTTNDSIFIENTSISFNGDIEENDARGIYTTGNNVFVSLDSCMLISNLSNDAGAAIRSPAELNINNCIFIDNNTDNFASAIYADGGDVTINSTRFLNNNSTFTNGSLLYKTSSNNYYIFDSIFLNNDGYMFGGTNQSSLFTVTNSVFWNNEITNDSNVNTNITYSCIENGWAGSGNISEDPQFCNPYSNSFSLSDNSPCIGTGFNNANMGGLDVGCSQTINTLYLDENGNDNGSGSIDDPINDIQLAFQRVFHEDTIFVNSGNYYPDEAVVFSKSIAFIGEDSSSAIINIENMTYLESNIQNIEDVTVLFENIKFQGSTNWTNDWVFMLWNGDYEFNKCSFFNINNTHTIRVINSNLLINKSSFNSSPTSDDINSSSTNGSSLILNDINIIQDSFIIEMPNILDSLLIENHIFESKYLDFEVGYFSLKNSVVNNCSFGLIAGENIFENNIVSNSDISLSNQYHSDKILINKCLFYDFSGQVNSYGDSLIVSKSTFVNNSNSILFQLLNSSTGNLTNSIIKTNGNDLLNLVSNQTSFNADYNLIDFSYNDGWGASNNVTITNVIYDNPLFFDPENDNYQLQWGSPAIDAGDPNSPNDPDGTRADMGYFYFDQNDTVPPVVNITSVLPIGAVGTENELIVSWVATDNWFLDSAFFDFLYSDTLLRVDTSLAELGQLFVNVPDFTVDSLRCIITVWDTLHNESKDTSMIIGVYDNTPPSIIILSPDSSYSISEYNELSMQWSAYDNIELADSVEAFYSNDSGSTFIEVGEFLTSDSIGTFIIPEGISNNAQIKLLLEDIFGNSNQDLSDFFSVTDNTPPTIELLSPIVGTDLEIGSITQINWSTSDNDSISHVNIEFNVDGAGWNIAVDNETDDGEYGWLVPDFPSNDVKIRIIAVDAVGLTDTAIVEGLNIIIVYPTITSVYPEESVIGWSNNQLKINFSQAVDISTITNDNIEIVSSYEEQLFPSFSFENQNSKVAMNFVNGFATSDSISITINPEVTNAFGYELDGNGDGVSGDAFSYTYYIQMLADYDTTNTIDGLDLATFVQALEEKDLSKELGPVTGTVPYFYFTPDSMLDIEDVMGFVMMWNWYITNNGGQLRVYENIGNPIEIETNVDSIFFDLPAGVVAYEVQIQHDPKSIIFGTVISNGSVKLQDTDEELGLFNLICSSEENTRVVIPINLLEEDTKVTLSIRTIGNNRNIIGQQTKILTIDNIPKKYALHFNYPNPFNPTTTIRYDLPTDSEVHLVVYDVLGREVKTLINESQEAGFKSVRWNGRNDKGQQVSAGMYFYRIRAGKFSKVQKMVLLK